MTPEDEEAIRTMATLMSWVATGCHGEALRVHLEQHGFTEATWQDHYTRLAKRFQAEAPLAEAYAAFYQEECRARFAAASGRSKNDVNLARDWGEVMQIAERHRERHEAAAHEAAGYRPNLDAIAMAIAGGSAVADLLDRRDTVFVIDHREDVLDIIGIVAARLPEGALVLDGLNEDGVVLGSNGRTIPVALTDAPGDRDAMVRACNEVLAPEYEIRFCVDSDGSDTLAFIVLNAADWQACEAAHGRALEQRIVKLPARALF